MSDSTDFLTHHLGQSGLNILSVIGSIASIISVVSAFWSNSSRKQAEKIKEQILIEKENIKSAIKYSDAQEIFSSLYKSMQSFASAKRGANISKIIVELKSDISKSIARLHPDNQAPENAYLVEAQRLLINFEGDRNQASQAETKHLILTNIQSALQKIYIVKNSIGGTL